MTRWTACLAALVLLFGACGSDENGNEPGANSSDDGGGFTSDLSDAKAYPIFVSSEIVVGENRFLVGLLDSNDAPIGSPEIEMSIVFRSKDGTELPAEDMEFTWIVPDERGLYVAHPTFEEAGDWTADVTISGGGFDEKLRQAFEVAESGTTPAVGAPAPKSDTPTADEVKSLAEISTDNNPDPRFYKTSIAEAIKQGKPFVVVFATPKFCSSQVCGPTLDDVKKISRDFPKLTFIHSEIYKDLEPTNPVVPAVVDWGLPSEPWVFVVDRAGKVAAKYEGSATAEEIRPVLEQL